MTHSSNLWSVLNILWKDRCWSWISKNLATWRGELTHWKNTLILGNIEGGRRRGRQRMRWLMASLTQWTWDWANSGSWWRTGKPGMLQSLGLQRIIHHWVNELNPTELPTQHVRPHGNHKICCLFSHSWLIYLE